MSYDHAYTLRCRVRHCDRDGFGMGSRTLFPDSRTPNALTVLPPRLGLWLSGVPLTCSSVSEQGGE